MDDQTFEATPQLDIDPAFLTRMAKMGSDQLVIDLINMYFTRSVELIDAIGHGVQAGDDDDSIRNAAHSLISSAGNLGGKKVSDLAKQIELAAMNGDADTLKKLHPELIIAQGDFIQYLTKDLETR